MRHTAVAVVFLVGIAGVARPLAAQNSEYVTVQRVTDDGAVIVLRNGAIYSIQKGIGCLSLSRYEGRTVVITSPSAFLGAGSVLSIPQSDQRCRIWSSEEVQSQRTEGAGEARCYDSSILSPTPFMGNNGEIFRLADGSLWEVKFEYQYMYQYYPSVIACPSSGRIVVAGKTLNAQLLQAPRSQSISQGTGAPHDSSTSAATPPVIETRIDGEFSGWEGETIFKLANGQIWQQASAAYRYHYAFSPSVLIYRSGSVYKMRVDNVAGEIIVRRLR